MWLAVLTIQYQHVIRAHWKCSGRIWFLWKMLIMSTSKLLAGLCSMALPSQKGDQARGELCHILHCPGQSFLGTNRIGQTLKSCWQKSCFSVMEKLKGIFSQFNNNNINVYLHRKCWNLYFHLEFVVCLFGFLFKKNKLVFSARIISLV